MKQITKWKAEDGSEFTDMDECVRYENLCSQVDSIMAAFPKRPEDDGCRFTNGGGYIQLSSQLVKVTRRKLLDVIATKINHKWIKESKGEGIHPSYVSRLVGDCGIRPFSNAWHRFECIDKQWREWGQPYFASHPDKGNQVELVSA